VSIRHKISRSANGHFPPCWQLYVFEERKVFPIGRSFCDVGCESSKWWMVIYCGKNGGILERNNKFQVNGLLINRNQFKVTECLQMAL
jgi:glycine cleavage system H lipoate-binding protein